MYNFTVVITTYNRPNKVYELVHQLLSLDLTLTEVIIIDSSEEINHQLEELDKVNYVISYHKNQPYQRFLGFKKAKGKYVLFLDDDMEITDCAFLDKIHKILLEKEAIALALNFSEKHPNTTLSAVPKSLFFQNNNTLKNFKNWFTGLPNLSEGKLGLCGNRGKQPIGKGLLETQYVSGGAFLAKREFLFRNFNFQLFDLFEKKLGMGEDALIGYGLHKYGKILFIPDIYFVHNDQNDSSYSSKIYSYSRRVIFSRLYLSLEKARLDGKGKIFARLHFHWYSFWRISGKFLNVLLKNSSTSTKNFRGTCEGYLRTFSFKYDYPGRNYYWEKEIQKNLK